MSWQSAVHGATLLCPHAAPSAALHTAMQAEPYTRITTTRIALAISTTLTHYRSTGLSRKAVLQACQNYVRERVALTVGHASQYMRSGLGQ